MKTKNFHNKVDEISFVIMLSPMIWGKNIMEMLITPHMTVLNAWEALKGTVSRVSAIHITIKVTRPKGLMFVNNIILAAVFFANLQNEGENI